MFGENLLEWRDRFGNYHPVINLGSNSCDHNNPTWQTNAGYIQYRSLLPITGIRYGPLEHASQKAQITVGELECLPLNPDKQQISLQAQINDLKSWITGKTILHFKILFSSVIVSGDSSD